MLMPIIPFQNWNQEPFSPIVQNAILAFIISSICSGKLDSLQDLREAIRQIPDAPRVLPLYLINFPEDDTNKAQDAIAGTLLSLRELIKSGGLTDLTKAIWITGSLWNCLTHSDFKKALGPMVAAYINILWAEFIREHEHILRYPSNTIEKMQGILSKPNDDVVRLAEIALIAEEAATNPLPDWLRTSMRTAVDKASLNAAK
jgi:hypothetical protein